MFYCNKADDGRCVVLPVELVVGVKAALGIELSDKATELLWKNLPVSLLQAICKSQSLPIYGTKDEVVTRLTSAEIAPSAGLSGLKNEDLYAICGKLPGVKVAGSKQERVERIINHFDKLVIRSVDAAAAPGQMFYEYFVELARRDRENLLANDVIRKDIDIERAFEEATRYLFREKLGVELIEMAGNDHPDGAVAFPDNTLLMWDNKSKEDTYSFPNSHLNQFKRYIRDSIDRRVNCFMIIVPDIAAEAEMNCLRLKHESQQDTDIGIITAEDLKWVAESWKDQSKTGKFNLAVFNQTGLLSRKRLEQTMGIFL